MIRKKRGSIQWGRAGFFILLAGTIAGGIAYRIELMRLWEALRPVFASVDVGSILRDLRRETFGVYCAGQECYVFDTEGILFDQARSVVGDVIVRVEETIAAPPLLYRPIMEPALWNAAALVFQAAHANTLDARRFVFLRREKELVAYVGDRNLPVYISLEFNPADHLRALPLFFKKVNRDELEYIDFRAEGKIFYK